ncbi:MAG: alpha/beta hydrolase [Phycisphaerae bacterium]|nr:alpha/beta hydrolase [Phycisphaerae bacterium]
MRCLDKPVPVAALLCFVVWFVAGCGLGSDFNTPDRLENGLVIILPGIEGKSGLNRDIRDGLAAAGIDQAIQIRSWGVIPLLKQMDFIGNRLAGAIIAQEIVAYQDKHPGRPVYVLGHSGGGGIAVFVAEGMPKGRQVDGLILLSASISSAHNLTKALKHCKNGIANFYNRNDAALLGVVTILFGNVCGTHGPAAGLIGFDKPGEKASDEKKLAYAKLYPVALTDDMTLGDSGAHVSTTRPDFVSIYVAPWVLSQQWPAMDWLATLTHGTAETNEQESQPPP